MPARLKQFVAAVCTFSLLLLLTPSPIRAATTYLNTNPDVPRNTHTTAQVLLIDISSALLCQLIGVDVVSPDQSCLGIDRETNKIGFTQTAKNNNGQPQVGGALGAMVGMISMTYNMPVHTGDYVAYVASNFGVAKPVYAQGTGFENLSALLSLWSRVRDLSYLAFVLIFVIIGFGIMLRVKLDPRTVMSIQNQIPKVVISILLITLSYAIAGLLIDMMWVTTYTGINIITADTAQCQNNQSLTEVATVNLLTTPIHYVNSILGCASSWGTLAIEDLASKVGITLGDILSRVLLATFGFYNVPDNCSWNPSTWDQCAQVIVFNLFKYLIGIVAMLAIVIAVFVQLFKVWFTLLKSYIYIILYTVAAPIYILLGLLPGSSFGFTAWIRRMVFTLSVYPVTVFLFLVAYVLINDPAINDPSQVFIPPLIANPAIADNMGYIIGLAVILIAPEVVNMMRDALKTPPSKYTGGIFAGIGAGSAAISSPLKQGWSSLNARDQAGAAKGPLAFATDTFVGNRIRGLAQKSEFLSRAFNKRYGDVASKGDITETTSGAPVRQRIGANKVEEVKPEGSENGSNGDEKGGAANPTDAGNPPQNPPSSTPGGTGAQAEIPTADDSASSTLGGPVTEENRQNIQNAVKAGTKEGVEEALNKAQGSTLPQGNMPNLKGTAESSGEPGTGEDNSENA